MAFRHEFFARSASPVDNHGTVAGHLFNQGENLLHLLAFSDNVVELNFSSLPSSGAYSLQEDAFFLGFGYMNEEVIEVKPGLVM